MSATISIAGKEKRAVVRALFKHSRSNGMGIFEASAPGADVLSDEEIDAGLKLWRFDYLHGRVMKADVRGDEFDPRLYDRDNGQGAAERALRAEGVIE